MHRKGFASDNYSGVHPSVFKALQEANVGHVEAYGSDLYTEKAVQKFKELLGNAIDVYFVFNGTAANVLGIKAVTESFNAVICSDNAHINIDECGAPELFTGCKLLSILTPDGKLTVELIKSRMIRKDDQHHVQPKVISITQSTEYGTVYTPDEIKAIAKYAHENNLLLHMDGARIANAIAHLNIDIKEITTHAGVDILSFGGTKNGMMYGEAVIFFNQKFSKQFKFIRKQGMQLASKMRFIAAQFSALFANNLWIENARHANAMASLLAYHLRSITGITITHKVEGNAIFAIIPPQYISFLQEQYAFYVWDEHLSQVRLMTSYDTVQEDIEGFVQIIKETIK